MIEDFYKDSEIFITGGSGVVGKALIDKLLRSTEVRRIYVLLRPKKNNSVEERLKKLCANKLFRTLKSQKPEQFKKIVAIPGDAVLPKLGIPPEYEKLLKDVSIFFHCAATVRFDEPLRVALRLNVGGTLEALKLAETFKHLKMFTHVSTFFSNPYLTYVEPKVYPSPIDWRVGLKLLDSDVSDEQLDYLCKKIITGFPNTYTFTKNLAENMVNDFRGRLPLAIFRPSIVVFALNEPEPGYPPSLMGAMGLFTVTAVGVLKIVYTDSKVVLDITPQDVCVKLMLYYTWKAATCSPKSADAPVPVYMTSSRQLAHKRLEDFENFINKHDIWVKMASEKCFMIPACKFTSCYYHYMLIVFLKQILPALLGDGFLRLFGYKPAIMGVVRKAFVALHEMRAFLFNDFDSPGYTDVETMITDVKGTAFDLGMEIADVESDAMVLRNCTNMSVKIREILLKEDPATLEKSRKIMQIKIYAYNIIRALLAYYLLRWLYRAVFT